MITKLGVLCLRAVSTIHLPKGKFNTLHLHKLSRERKFVRAISIFDREAV
jgi:hypothetical protein